jgi:hypothetical protein
MWERSGVSETAKPPVSDRTNVDPAPATNHPTLESQRGHFTTRALADDCARFLAESRRRAQARSSPAHATRRFS